MKKAEEGSSRLGLLLVVRAALTSARLRQAPLLALLLFLTPSLSPSWTEHNCSPDQPAADLLFLLTPTPLSQLSPPRKEEVGGR